LIKTVSSSICEMREILEIEFGDSYGNLGSTAILVIVYRVNNDERAQFRNAERGENNPDAVTLGMQAGELIPGIEFPDNEE